MSSITIGLISVACIFGGALLGLWLRDLLPDHHLSGNSKDAVKVGAGMIATVAALVLGLLVGSAKNSFDTASAGITQVGTKIILLDRALAQYGSAAQPAREQLRRNVAGVVQVIWPEVRTGVSGLTAAERGTGLEDLQKTLLTLTPQNDYQRQLLSQAQQLLGDVSQIRWLVIEQSQGALPTVFLVVLLFWLTMLHMSFGLLADTNATVIIVLFLCAVSVSAAIFLILEMNHPIDGLIQVSGAPMRKALEIIGR